MDSLPLAHWTRFKHLFSLALSLPESEWPIRLAEACPDEPDLVREVLALLGTPEPLPATSPLVRYFEAEGPRGG